MQSVCSLYVILSTHRRCLKAYPLLCSLMALDQSSHKKQFTEILDYYAKRKTCFTLYRLYPLTTTTHLTIIGYTFSCFFIVSSMNNRYKWQLEIGSEVTPVSGHNSLIKKTIRSVENDEQMMAGVALANTLKWTLSNTNTTIVHFLLLESRANWCLSCNMLHTFSSFESIE
jgi:hypothetical protein